MRERVPRRVRGRIEWAGEGLDVRERGRIDWAGEEIEVRDRVSRRVQGRTDWAGLQWLFLHRVQIHRAKGM